MCIVLYLSIFYSASHSLSEALPTTIIDSVLEFTRTRKHYRQLQVKDEPDLNQCGPIVRTANGEADCECYRLSIECHVYRGG